ncbi:MAG: hypothetical protein ILO10_03130 [Kiritimatiellae bacterium]|nr:hypothetical protein [Kiritimatiellia bacterium]
MPAMNGLHFQMWIGVAILLACGCGHQRDVDRAKMLYNGFRPNFNLDAPQAQEEIEKNVEASFPETGKFKTTTEFFVFLMDEEWICGANYGLFALPGVPAYPGTNSCQFSARNNAWCVVLDYPLEWFDEVPFLFSRNLGISSLTDANADALLDISPYGKTGVLVVYPQEGGCRAEFLLPSQIEDTFRKHGATNGVLRP